MSLRTLKAFCTSVEPFHCSTAFSQSILFLPNACCCFIHYFHTFLAVFLSSADKLLKLLWKLFFHFPCSFISSSTGSLSPLTGLSNFADTQTYSSTFCLSFYLPINSPLCLAVLWCCCSRVSMRKREYFGKWGMHRLQDNSAKSQSWLWGCWFLGCHLGFLCQE